MSFHKQKLRKKGSNWKVGEEPKQNFSLLKNNDYEKVNIYGRINVIRINRIIIKQTFSWTFSDSEHIKCESSRSEWPDFWVFRQSSDRRGLFGLFTSREYSLDWCNSFDSQCEKNKSVLYWRQEIFEQFELSIFPSDILVKWDKLQEPILVGGEQFGLLWELSYWPSEGPKSLHNSSQFKFSWLCDWPLGLPWLQRQSFHWFGWNKTGWQYIHSSKCSWFTLNSCPSNEKLCANSFEYVNAWGV